MECIYGAASSFLRATQLRQCSSAAWSASCTTGPTPFDWIGTLPFYLASSELLEVPSWYGFHLPDVIAHTLASRGIPFSESLASHSKARPSSAGGTRQISSRPLNCRKFVQWAAPQPPLPPPPFHSAAPLRSHPNPHRTSRRSCRAVTAFATWRPS